MLLRRLCLYPVKTRQILSQLPLLAGQVLRRLTYRLTERGLYTKRNVIKEKGEIRDGFRNIVIKSYSNKVIEEKGLKSGNNRKGEGQLT